jgi:hypothetical protein
MLQDFKISFYINSHVDKLFKNEKGWLVRHYWYYCAEGRWMWNDGEGVRRRRVEL